MIRRCRLQIGPLAIVSATLAFPGIGLIAVTALPVPASAQAPGTIQYATTSAAVRPAIVKRGGHTSVVVTIKIAPQFHINSVKPADADLIPTKLAINSAAGFKVGSPVYPPNKTVRESYSPKPMLVYQGTATIRVPITVESSAAPGKHVLSGALSYQGCNQSACYPPKSVPVNVTVTVR